MPLLTFAVLALMFLGSVLGNPKPAPSQESAALTAPEPRPAAMTPELSASMFHGIVRSIDWQALRVTIQTDFGRVVPVAVESCDVIEGLKIGDRVRLAVDTRGIVYAMEAQSPSSRSSTSPASSVRPTGHCRETIT